MNDETPATAKNSTPEGQLSLCEILDQIESRANAATPGPWKKCSASKGKCRCEDIWSVPADSPVCACNDKWGDPYASLRCVEGSGLGSIGAKVEAYEDMIVYGDLGEAAKQANKDFIAAARCDVPALVKALRRAINGIEATLRDNRHLADGENCTLIVLKRTLPSVAQLLREPEKKQDLEET